MKQIILFLSVLACSGIIPFILFLSKKHFKKIPLVLLCIFEIFVCQFFKYFFLSVLTVQGGYVPGILIFLGMVALMCYINTRNERQDHPSNKESPDASVDCNTSGAKIISFPSEGIKKPDRMRNALIITSVVSCILLVYSSIITFYPQAAEKLSAMATGSETYEEKYKKLKKKYDILKEDSEGADSANSDLIDQNVDLHEELYEARDALDYVVFVGPDEYYYHSYDCPKLDMSSFLAFNTEAAIDEGYVPCSWCQE